MNYEVIYHVIGYEQTITRMEVEANTREEALEKAKKGQYIDKDSDPGPDILLNKWYVENDENKS